MFVRNALRGLLLIGAVCLPGSVVAQQVTVSYQDGTNTLQFGTLDLATGTPTAIAPQTNTVYTGLAYTPNGALYGSTLASFFVVGAFGSIDPTTGNFTPIGTPPNVGTNLAANNNTSLATTFLDFSSSGGTQLAYVDTTTGTPTLAGAPDTNGFSANLGNLIYGPNGSLYLLVDANTIGGVGNGLYTVDPVTGVKTLVFDDPLIDNTIITGLVTVGNTIYGFSYNGTVDNIVTIDPAAHTVTPTGVTVAGTGIVFAAAYVPEPGNVALLGGLAVTGAGFLARRRRR